MLRELRDIIPALGDSSLYVLVVAARLMRSRALSMRTSLPN